MGMYLFQMGMYLFQMGNHIKWVLGTPVSNGYRFQMGTRVTYVVLPSYILHISSWFLSLNGYLFEMGTYLKWVPILHWNQLAPSLTCWRHLVLLLAPFKSYGASWRHF